MRDFLEELKATDDIVGFLAEHRKETIKFGLLILAVMTVLLLFLYRGGDEVDIRDTATPLGAEEDADGAGYGDGSGADGKASLSGDGAAQPGVATNGVAADGVTVGNGYIYVDIGGAVKKPMLAKLSSGSRVEDAIEQAGGLETDADITQINRAEILIDGQKIYIPKKGESGYPGSSSSDVTGGSAGSGGTGSGGGVAGSGGAGGPVTGKVNINTADITQLQTLTGVGPVTAQKIIDYRTQSGKFSRIEDLKNVSGIGDKTFENMKDQITV